MHELGAIVRLQVQVAPLKRGDKPDRWYDPDRLRPVDRLIVTPDGAVGEVGGQQVVDVHHADHPQSRHRDQASGLSIMFTSHYQAMRARFGDHATDGTAGESVLVAVDHPVRAEDLAGAVLRGAAGTATVVDVQVAEPCVEFSRFMACQQGGLREPLQALGGGVRGFYLALDGPITLERGDSVLVAG